MRVLLRALLGVLGLTLASSLLISAPADAAPPPDPAPQMTRAAGGRSSVTLTAAQWKAAKYVTKARNKAVSSGGGSMNYAKMKDIFADAGKYGTDWRRQMAAGYRQAGGKITKISKSENKKVEKRRKQMYGSGSPLRQALVGARRACRGKSGTVVVNSKETHKYYNSCETTDLKYYWGGCIGAMTFLGKFTEKKPKLDMPRYFIAAACGFALGVIQRASDKSDIGAIYLRTYKQESYNGYLGTQYFISYSLKPQ